MEDRKHLDFLVVAVHDVDDSIVAVNDFADRLVLNLWHCAAHARKRLQRAKLLDHLFLEDLREVGRTNALVFVGAGVFMGLEDFGYLAKAMLASAAGAAADRLLQLFASFESLDVCLVLHPS